jgi:hypothetical protein
VDLAKEEKAKVTHNGQQHPVASLFKFIIINMRYQAILHGLHDKPQIRAFYGTAFALVLK